MQKSIFRAAIEALEVAEKEAALLEDAEQQRAHIIASAYAEAEEIRETAKLKAAALTDKTLRRVR
jgi:F0F1-type ATP synthase membrane subunit b/b'